MTVSFLAEKIINGFRLDRNFNADLLLSAELSELCGNADKIRCILCGNRADLCSIINGRSGKCFENCRFCAQSAHYCTEIYI